MPALPTDRPANPMMRRFFLWCAGALLVAACGAGDLSTTSTTEPPLGGASPSDTASDETAPPTATQQTTTTLATEPSPTPGSTTTAAPGAASPSPDAGEDTEDNPGATAPAHTDDQAPEVQPDTEPDPLPVIEGLGARASEQVWETVAITEEIRGLEFNGLPTITVLSPEEFAARVRMEVESELEGVEVDEALYKLLGLLEPEDDLAALYSEMYGEGVAGFYASDQQELVLPRAGDEFSSLELLTLFHELVHAVSDQHFGFGPAADALADAHQYDQATGLVSLVEGDATVSEVLYVESLTPAQLDELVTDFSQMETPGFSVPLFMEQALYFPYERGFDYVWNVWEMGGWQAVNELYADPPISTEEVFEGAASPDTLPIQMERPEGRWPEGYQEVYDFTWGFLDIYLMFEQVLGAQAARDAAGGWGGSRSLVAYHESGDVVFVWEYTGDSPEETEELARLLFDYAHQAMDVGMPASDDQPPGFVGNAGDYIFVDRIDNRMVMVACSDPRVCPSVTAPYRAGS